MVAYEAFLLGAVVAYHLVVWLYDVTEVEEMMAGAVGEPKVVLVFAVRLA